jgi:hypothetical protein
MSRSGSQQRRAVENYVTAVADRLPGSRQAHSGIMAELRSGLLDAADSYEAAGLPPAEAAAAAIREFGAPGVVADAFLPEITASQARRAVVVLLVTGPVVGLLWLATAAAGHLAIRVPAFGQWGNLPADLGTGILLVAVAVAITALAGVVGIAATGRLARRQPPGSGRAPVAAAIAGFGAIGADGLGILLLVAALSAAPGNLPPLLAATAAVASALRILLAVRAAHRCLALRASRVR